MYPRPQRNVTFNSSPNIRYISPRKSSENLSPVSPKRPYFNLQNLQAQEGLRRPESDMTNPEDFDRAYDDYLRNVQEEIETKNLLDLDIDDPYSRRLKQLRLCMQRAGHNIPAEQLQRLYEEYEGRFLNMPPERIVSLIRYMDAYGAYKTCSASSYINEICLDNGIMYDLEFAFRTAALYLVAVFTQAGINQPIWDMIIMTEENVPILITKTSPLNVSDWTFEGQSLSTEDVVKVLVQELRKMRTTISVTISEQAVIRADPWKVLDNRDWKGTAVAFGDLLSREGLGVAQRPNMKGQMRTVTYVDGRDVVNALWLSPEKQQRISDETAWLY